jgi:hypothetical protein
MSSSLIRPLELFGDKESRMRSGHKVRSDRFQCSECGVMVGKWASVCGHCGADLR